MDEDRGLVALSVDASVLIQAARYKYPFDIAPGFWDALVGAGRRGDLLVTREIFEEIMRCSDELSAWLKEHKGALVKDDRDAETHSALAALEKTVRGRMPKYYESAVYEFFDCGDSWLIAHSWAHGHTVVHEESPGQLKVKRVMIPDVCDILQVPHMPTIDMIRAVGIRWS